jgi:hypothetical protein
LGITPIYPARSPPGIPSVSLQQNLQKPFVPINPLDDLSVEFQDQVQYTMFGGLLRAEVDRVVLNLDVVLFERLDPSVLVGHARCPV